VDEANGKYMNVLEEFRKITDIPVVLNTSFNRHGDPMVCYPKNAILELLSGSVEALAIGSFMAYGKSIKIN